MAAHVVVLRCDGVQLQPLGSPLLVRFVIRLKRTTKAVGETMGFSSFVKAVLCGPSRVASNEKWLIDKTHSATPYVI